MSPVLLFVLILLAVIVGTGVLILAGLLLLSLLARAVWRVTRRVFGRPAEPEPVAAVGRERFNGLINSPTHQYPVITDLEDEDAIDTVVFSTANWSN